jgi:hypothetical protein
MRTPTCFTRVIPGGFNHLAYEAGFFDTKIGKGSLVGDGHVHTIVALCYYYTLTIQNLTTKTFYFQFCNIKKLANISHKN